MDRRSILLSLLGGLGTGVAGSLVRAGDKTADPAVLARVISCGTGGGAGHTCGTYIDPLPGCQPNLSTCVGESCPNQFVCENHDCVEMHSCNGGPGSHGCSNYHFFPHAPEQSQAQADVALVRGRLASIIDAEDSEG